MEQLRDLQVCRQRACRTLHYRLAQTGSMIVSLQAFSHYTCSSSCCFQTEASCRSISVLQTSKPAASSRGWF